MNREVHDVEVEIGQRKLGVEIDSQIMSGSCYDYHWPHSHTVTLPPS